MTDVFPVPTYSKIANVFGAWVSTPNVWMLFQEILPLRPIFMVVPARCRNDTGRFSTWPRVCQRSPGRLFSFSASKRLLCVAGLNLTTYGSDSSGECLEEDTVLSSLPRQTVSSEGCLLLRVQSCRVADEDCEVGQKRSSWHSRMTRKSWGMWEGRACIPSPACWMLKISETQSWPSMFVDSMALDSAELKVKIFRKRRMA